MLVSCHGDANEAWFFFLSLPYVERLALVGVEELQMRHERALFLIHRRIIRICTWANQGRSRYCCWHVLKKKPMRKKKKKKKKKKTKNKKKRNGSAHARQTPNAPHNTTTHTSSSI
jgi:hypothetical protein